MEPIWIFFIAVGWFVAFSVTLYLTRKKKRKYDEMQLVARQQAAVHSFALLLVCNFLSIVVWRMEWCELQNAILVGSVLSATVFGCECILKNAYFCVGEEGKTGWMWLLGLMAVTFYIRGIKELRNGLLQTVVPGSGWTTLVCAGAITILLFACAIQTYRNRREWNKEE